MAHDSIASLFSEIYTQHCKDATRSKNASQPEPTTAFQDALYVLGLPLTPYIPVTLYLIACEIWKEVTDEIIFAMMREQSALLNNFE